MVRYIIIGSALVILILIALSMVPAKKQESPKKTIDLTNVSVALYPLSDPVAVWRFTAPNLDYDPESRETKLYNLVEGNRNVFGERDFSLVSDEIIIDSTENLIGNYIELYLLDADWLLKLQGRNGQPVTIAQAKGKFLPPEMDFTGRGLGNENHAENVSVNFDLSDFMADCLDATCVNQFADKVNPKEQR